MRSRWESTAVTLLPAPSRECQFNQYNLIRCNLLGENKTPTKGNLTKQYYQNKETTQKQNVAKQISSSYQSQPGLGLGLPEGLDLGHKPEGSPKAKNVFLNTENNNTYKLNGLSGRTPTQKGQACWQQLHYVRGSLYGTIPVLPSDYIEGKKKKEIVWLIYTSIKNKSRLLWMA